MRNRYLLGLPIEGKKILGTIGAVTGVTGTTYMISELAKDKYDGPVYQLQNTAPAITDEELEDLKKLAATAEELKKQKEITEAAISQLKTDLQAEQNRSSELDKTITALTEENERVNTELDTTKNLYIDASSDNISTRQQYAKQTMEYSNAIKTINALKNQLNKFETNNPLMPKPGCWVSPDKESNPSYFGLNCKTRYPKNNGEMRDVLMVSFAKKDEHPELFEEYKKLWEVQKSALIK